MNILSTIKNYNNIENLKNKEKDKRIYILGTGPSLSEVDFSLIKNEIFVGVNTLYHGYDKFKINPKYYCCSDGYTWDNIKGDIEKINSIFLLGHILDLEQREDLDINKYAWINFLGYVWRDRKFTYDLREGTYNSGSVIGDIAIPLALYLGCTKIYLLGVDCDYSKDHHFDDYKEEVDAPPLKGDWSQVFTSYSIIKNYLDETKIAEIINLTENSKLHIFKQENLKEII